MSGSEAKHPMTADTTPSLVNALGLIADALDGRGSSGGPFVREAASYITVLEGERRSIIANIPMNYLKAHDVAGATGPTASLDLVGAMRAYSEARWRIIDRCKEAEARAEAAEANARRLEKAARDVLALPASGDALSILKRGIGTKTANAAWLRLVDALEALTTKEADRGPE